MISFPSAEGLEDPGGPGSPDSLSSSTVDLSDDGAGKRYSHVCVLTYRTKDNEVLAVDLSYIGQDCYAIPSILGKIYGMQTRRLDLSFNSIKTLENLHMFPLLQELILDNNELDDFVTFMPLPQLHTLSLNKNLLHDLESLLTKLSNSYPMLSYLSLLGNPVCPDQLSNHEKDEEDYQRYRYYVIHHIPNLKFLDSRPVKGYERAEAQRVGPYMKVAKPVVEQACEASDETDDSFYSPLPVSFKKQGTHRGSFGKLRQRYTGTQSEGNRFIRDNEL